MRRTTVHTPANPSPPKTATTGPLPFMVLAGLFLFLVVVKLGDPVVLDSQVIAPKSTGEIVTDSWKIATGYWMMIPVFAAGLLAIRWKRPPRQWPLLLPLLWLGWQFISATQTVSPSLTSLTLAHFTACVGFFYLGLFALRGVRNPWPIWAGLGLALAWTMRYGMDQHFGGLEATRRFVLESNGAGLPPGILSNPDYLRRIFSDRIFGTFMYPNSFAAALLLLLPLTLVFVWQLTPKLRDAMRVAFVMILGGIGLACLYWSGSKAAWLIMVISGAIGFAHFPVSLAWKRWAIYPLLVIGVLGFAAMNADSVARHKTSMVARLDYWKAAVRITEAHPILGTGPGTFGVAYAQVKSPKSEMARLSHNDYLEQASDSGLFGCFAYSGLVLVSLLTLYRYRNTENDLLFNVRFAVWLGLLGLFLHSGMEFHLYYPALAWPAFFLLGWLWGLDEENTFTLSHLLSRVGKR